MKLANYVGTVVLLIATLFGSLSTMGQDRLAIRAQKLFPVSQPMIENGVVLVENGKIVAIGSAREVEVPAGTKVIEAPIVTPGLIDAHSVVGLAGWLNQKQDQDQVDSSAPVQPELRAIDAYNCQDELVTWVRQFGVTTLHTGFAPQELVPGQSIIVKTVGNTVEEAAINPGFAVLVNLTSSAKKESGSPGTRGKMVAVLRENLIKASEHLEKVRVAEVEKKEAPKADLKLEALAAVLSGKMRLIVTADRAQDIASAIRIAKEFKVPMILDSGAEAYLFIDELKSAGIPVLLHASMARATGDKENSSFETAAKLVHAGIPVAIQSGYEAYVPKTRVVLFEAGIAAANGLTFDEALRSITLEPAKILGIDAQVGSLEVGKDADIALYDGDPFEYTSHCVGTVINGKIVSEVVR